MLFETGLSKFPFLGIATILSTPLGLLKDWVLVIVFIMCSHPCFQQNELCWVHSWPKLDQSDSFPGNLEKTQSIQCGKLCKSSSRVCSWVSTMVTQSHIVQDKVIEDQRPRVSKESQLAKWKRPCLQDYAQRRITQSLKEKTVMVFGSSLVGSSISSCVSLMWELYILKINLPFNWD